MFHIRKNNSMNSMMYASIVINSKAHEGKVPLNKIYKWIDDELVTNCTLCNSVFSRLWNGKHHCRCCGRIFCSKCSCYHTIIPEDVSLVMNNTIDGHARVCKSCYDRILEFNKIIENMTIFIGNVKLLPENYIIPDIIFLYKIKRVNHTWKKYAEIKLNIFRELQYLLPNHKFTAQEKQLLWINTKYIIAHSKYLIQLLKSINYEPYDTCVQNMCDVIIPMLKQNDEELQPKNLIKIINTYEYRIENDVIFDEREPKMPENMVNINCTYMMCSRNCLMHHIPVTESIELLTENITDDYIRKFAISRFINIPHNELMCYISFLMFNMRHEIKNNFIIGNYLIDRYKNTTKKKEKLELANEIFWDIDDNFYETFMEILDMDIKIKLKKCKKMVDIIHTFDMKSKRNKKLVEETFNKINMNTILLPLKPNYTCKSILTNKIRFSTSVKKPLILPFLCVHDKKEKEYEVLFKFENIKNDAIVMSLIKIIVLILEKEGIETNIVTYNIRPTGNKSGFIEMVPDAHTLTYIQNDLGFSILNYIGENNSEQKIHTIRIKFLKSFAAYCVITYILGIGDRHSENIMLTKDGRLFHIDYAYMFGQDPKSLCASDMKILEDMIDAIGGTKSMYYKLFLDLCTDIYNCLRRHINLFINMTLQLTKHENKSTSETTLYEEFIKRMIPGENYAQAEIQLNKVIKNSSVSRYNMEDMIHTYGGSTMSSVKQCTSSLSWLFG